MASLAHLKPNELDARAEDSRRILAEHGVTCFVNREKGGSDEPWRLDILPLVLDSCEWQVLEEGLIQRARLLNLILGDLYGTQRLVRDGFVPAPLVFANPGYLRPCQAIKVPDGVYLHFYAADIGRSSDGGWWVLADRTQSPSGFGFALENRSILSRVLPEAFQEIQPRPLSHARGIRYDTIRQFGPCSEDASSVVLLTPGPRNEAYFEHAYLSRLLGLTLVEGADLTVRDCRVFVKTLNGLRRADVVLRRVNDAYCDPLELRGDSLLGVPGLVEATRARHVGVCNALGCGLMESPAFLPFLPGLCRHLLNEELRLPSLATWWCGQAREEHYVREHLTELSIRSALNAGAISTSPNEQSARQRTLLLEQVRMRPHEFVGQESIQLSFAPTWQNRRQSSQPFVLRVFVLWDGRDFSVVPGGLARLTDNADRTPATLRLHALSKDVWVLPNEKSDSPPPEITTTPQPQVERATSDLPSRTADNFYWLGRYTERLEQAVRVARYALRRLTDNPGVAKQRRLGPLTKLLTQLGLVDLLTSGEDDHVLLQRELLLFLFQDERPDGVRDVLRRIQSASYSVRDRLSVDTWRVLNRLGPDAGQRPGRLPLVQASAMSDALVLDLAAFNGMGTENMTRGHGWSFLDLGRRLERAVFITRLIDIVLRSGADMDWLLKPALEIGDSVMTHRRRYFSEPRLASTLEILVHEAANPRSLAFQIAAIAHHAAGLPAEANPVGMAQLRSQVNQLTTLLRDLQKLGITGEPSPAAVEQQAEGIGGLMHRLGELSDLLTQVYFSHVVPKVN